MATNKTKTTTTKSKKTDSQRKATMYKQTGKRAELSVSAEARNSVDGMTGAGITERSATRRFMASSSKKKKKS